jgi:cell division septation protein DedD
MKKKNMTRLSVIFTLFCFIALLGIIQISNVSANTVPANVLGTAGNFAILTKTGISTTGTTSITGNIGVSPAAATYITGFGLIADTSNTFSTSSLVIGKVYAANYATPTPTMMTTAISDMQTAYTTVAGLTTPAPVTALGAGNIGGLTITAGIYKWSTNVIIPSAVTLSGSSSDEWVFQIAGTLTVSSNVQVILSGGAQASNIFWVVAGQTTLGTHSAFNGIILDKTAIALTTGATLNGRALAQTAVTLQSNTITSPISTPTPTPTSSSTPTPTPTSSSTPTSTPKPTSTSSSTPTSTPKPTPTVPELTSSILLLTLAIATCSFILVKVVKQKTSKKP